MHNLFLIKKEGWKIYLITEGVGLPIIKVLFKTLGIVVSGGINNLKGTLSPTQYNLSRLMWCIVNVDAYKIITKYFYNDDKFLNKPFFDFTEKKNWICLLKQ